MTAPDAAKISDEHPQPGYAQKPFDLVPGMAEDFAAAGAAFLAACGGNTVLKLPGPGPEGLFAATRDGRFPP